MIILDTNVLSELMRTRPDDVVVDWIERQAANSLYVTTLSYAEILLGIRLMPDGRRQHHLAEQAEGMFTVDFAGRMLSFDAQSAVAYAALASERQHVGTRINPIDGMIAAIARVYGAAVASRDRDLMGCGVPLINPWLL
jgi:predicted nucleic acid-binding protein